MDPPEVSLLVVGPDEVHLIFSEILSSSITKDDIISVEITGLKGEGYIFTWTLSELVSAQEYSIKLNFEGEEIPSGTKISVKLRDSIQDFDDHTLTENTVSGEL